MHFVYMIAKVDEAVPVRIVFPQMSDFTLICFSLAAVIWAIRFWWEWMKEEYFSGEEYLRDKQERDKAKAERKSARMVQRLRRQEKFKDPNYVREYSILWFMGVTFVALLLFLAYLAIYA